MGTSHHIPHVFCDVHPLDRAWPSIHVTLYIPGAEMTAVALSLMEVPFASCQEIMACPAFSWVTFSRTTPTRCWCMPFARREGQSPPPPAQMSLRIGQGIRGYGDVRPQLRDQEAGCVVGKFTVVEPCDLHGCSPEASNVTRPLPAHGDKPVEVGLDHRRRQHLT